MADINIPYNDLTILYGEMKRAYENIIEAYQYMINGFEIVTSTGNYDGGSTDFFSTTYNSFIGNLDKLSTYYNVAYMYIFNTLIEFSKIDEEIAEFLACELYEMGYSGG